MIPAVKVPQGVGIKIPVDFKLRPQWRFNTARRVFESDSGESFSPRGALPKNSKIVYKVPSLAEASAVTLSEAEQDLQSYMQAILPEGMVAADYVEAIRSWPCVAEAHVAPQVSLP